MIASAWYVFPISRKPHVVFTFVRRIRLWILWLYIHRISYFPKQIPESVIEHFINRSGCIITDPNV